MDEITIDDKIYISSKRAAGITGYAKDYVGQLCREGRVEARLIGRSWYVLEDSIRKHRFVEAGAPGTVEPTESEVSEKTNVEAVWKESVYTSEEVQMLPVSEEIEEKVSELSEEPAVEESPVEEVIDEKEEEVSGIEDSSAVQHDSSQQNEWQDWFSGTVESTKQELTEEAFDIAPKAPEEAEPVEIHVIEDIQPVAPIHRYEAPEQTHKPLPHKKKSYLIHKAVAVAVIVFCLTIALIGSGAADRFQNNPFTDFLGGTSLVK